MRRNNIKNLFSILNIESNNCSVKFTRINNCTCILDEFNCYHKHYIKKLNKDCQTKNYDYIKILGLYFSNKLKFVGDRKHFHYKFVSSNTSCFAIESNRAWNRQSNYKK